MISAERRIAHYNARTAAGLISIDLPAMLAQQQANFAARIRQFYPYQIRTAAVLDAAAVSSVLRFGYQAFTNCCYRAWLTASGPALVAEVTRLQLLFESRGLEPTVLSTIAVSVWLTPPTP